MSKVVVLAKIRAAAGKRAELAKEFEVNLSEVEKEPGTLAYILHEDAKEEDVLWFYEVYSDQDAFKAHGSAEWMKALGPKLAPLMGGRPELIFLNPLGGKGLA
jgi:quinol monooxygenase YgiN